MFYKVSCFIQEDEINSISNLFKFIFRKTDYFIVKNRNYVEVVLKIDEYEKFVNSLLAKISIYKEKYNVNKNFNYFKIMELGDYNNFEVLFCSNDNLKKLLQNSLPDQENNNNQTNIQHIDYNITEKKVRDVSTQTDDNNFQHLDSNFTIVFNKLQKLKRDNLMQFLITMDKLKNSL